MTDRNATIAAMNTLVTAHKKAVAAKLREVAKEIQAEEELYAGMGYPALIATTFQNVTHLAGQLDPQPATE